MVSYIFYTLNTIYLQILAQVEYFLSILAKKQRL